jgi:alpha-galactosidase/6-phospho-beta-glucosidase family protein
MDKPTPQERKDATAELRKKQQPIFDALGIPDAKYIPKMAHHVSGLNGIHMGFFESELNHGEDVYTEMVSIMMESEDPTRTLYKYRYNPHFKDELVPSDEVISKSTRYYVPMDELEVVIMPANAKKKAGRPPKAVAKEENKTPIRTIVVDSTEDLPMEAMTIRDYIAIHTGNPVSAKPWINEIVTKN